MRSIYINKELQGNIELIHYILYLMNQGRTCRSNNGVKRARSLQACKQHTHAHKAFFLRKPHVFKAMRVEKTNLCFVALLKSVHQSNKQKPKQLYLATDRRCLAKERLLGYLRRRTRGNRCLPRWAPSNVLVNGKKLISVTYQSVWMFTRYKTNARPTVAHVAVLALCVGGLATSHCCPGWGAMFTVLVTEHVSGNRVIGRSDRRVQFVRKQVFLPPHQVVQVGSKQCRTRAGHGYGHIRRK